MPTGVNTKLQALLDKIDDLNATVTDLNTNVIGIASNLGTYMVDSLAALEAIATAATDISLAMGFHPEGSDIDVLTLLQDIRANTTTMCNANPPQLDDPDGCVSPFISNTQVAESDYDNRTFALFPLDDLPTGIIEGSFLDPAILGAALTHDAGSGWKAYVLSCSSPTFSINPNGSILLPTNRWVDVSAYEDMAFSVPVGGDIVAYLCTPLSAPFTECITLDSTPAHYSSETPIGTTVFSVDCQCLTYGDVPSATCEAHQDYGTPVPTAREGFDVDCSVYTNNANGYTFTLTAADNVPILIIWVSPEGARDFGTLDSVSDTLTITTDTASFMVLNSGASSPSTSTFSVEICPPA